MLIKTPNIDKLYSMSTRFTDYHVSPTCAPTRAAIMTGQHYDVFPTLVDLCKLNIDPEIKFDGQSLVPLMNGKTEDFEEKPYFIIGHEAENPISLVCHDWHSKPDFTPWAQRYICSEYINNGFWRVRVAVISWGFDLKQIK